MKRIVFDPNIPAEIRAIDRRTAYRILVAIHRYAETGEGDVKALGGELQGFVRLRIGDFRVVFEETADTIRINRVRARGDIYR